PGREEITFDRLISWSDSPDEAVKYFSGTAVYRKSVKVPKNALAKGQKVALDLGRACDLAEVAINGRELGVLWKLQKTVDVTQFLDPEKENILEIRVTNLWPNRLIGDASLPPEPERRPDGTLERWPQWLLDGTPDPSGRQTFCMWDLWKKDDALIPSGLIGPVRLVFDAGWHDER
ncbi:MAG: glycosyl hydrolase family 43, partial [Tannerella sp.]|nr:glycosyl hydrolase family 43 [Tannerella sp.]